MYLVVGGRVEMGKRFELAAVLSSGFRSKINQMSPIFNSFVDDDVECDAVI